MSCPRSLMTTSAARSTRLSLAPVAIADKVPVEQGHTTICFGAAEPDATGENHSSLPHAMIWPALASKRLVKKAATASGLLGNLRFSSVANTTLAADEIST